MVTGSTIMPLSERFTRSTSSACLSMDMLRWMMPMPPCCASAMARWDSVTVSMAELTTGMFKPILRVNQVRVSVSAGTILLREGTSRTSSKVRPSGIVSGIMRGTFDDTACPENLVPTVPLCSIDYELEQVAIGIAHIDAGAGFSASALARRRAFDDLGASPVEQGFQRRRRSLPDKAEIAARRF